MDDESMNDQTISNQMMKINQSLVRVTVLDDDKLPSPSQSMFDQRCMFTAINFPINGFAGKCIYEACKTCIGHCIHLRTCV